jgi:putative hydrolase of the HAD superfamily
MAEIEGLRYSRLFTVFPDVAALLSELRDRGITVGICSNWDWDLDRQLRHNSLNPLIDFVVCSAVCGYRKPHPEIFASVIALAGLPADQIVFVGDNLSDDIAGAATAGLRPVHVDRQGACQPGDHAEVPCLRDLDQVLDLVGS